MTNVNAPKTLRNELRRGLTFNKEATFDTGLKVTSGTTTFNAGLSTSGSVDVSAGATFNLNAGNVDLSNVGQELTTADGSILQSSVGTEITVLIGSIGVEANGVNFGTGTVDVDTTVDTLLGTVRITGFTAGLTLDRDTEYAKLEEEGRKYFGDKATIIYDVKVSTGTTSLYLRDVRDGENLSTIVVLGDDATELDGGDFGAGKTATVGGVNGNMHNFGTLTLTGEDEAKNVLVQGDAENSGTLNLQGGSITGDLINNSGTVNIQGATSVDGDTDLKGTAVLKINNGSLSGKNLTAQSGNVIYVGEATQNFGDSYSITDAVSLNGASIFAASAFDGFENASAVFMKSFANGIDGHVINGQDSYTVLGSGDRAYAEAILGNSKLT